jgi:hypothetical protein
MQGSERFEVVDVPEHRLLQGSRQSFVHDRPLGATLMLRRVGFYPLMRPLADRLERDA